MSNLERIVFVLACNIFFSACNREKTIIQSIQLSQYKQHEFEKDNPIIMLTLLHAYPGDRDDSIANLYVCQLLDSKDSLLVFDLSENQEDFVFKKRNEGQGFFINQSNVQYWTGESIKVKVPEGFVVPDRGEYIFSILNTETDSDF